MKLLLGILLVSTLSVETLCDKGLAALKSTDFASAVEYYEQALESVPSDSVNLLTDIYNRLTFAYFTRGMYAEASHYGQLSLEMNEQIGDAYGVSTSLALLSGIMIHQGRDDQAEEYMLRSLETEQTAQSHKILAKRLVVFGKMFFNSLEAELEKARVDAENQKLARRLHRQQMIIVSGGVLVILLIVILMLFGKAYRLQRDMIRTEQSARQLLREEVTPAIDLSDRELEIVKLCCKGKLSKEIADELNISKKTVDNHKASIYKKLNIGNNTELIIYAAKHNLIEL